MLQEFCTPGMPQDALCKEKMVIIAGCWMLGSCNSGVSCTLFLINNLSFSKWHTATNCLLALKRLIYYTHREHSGLCPWVRGVISSHLTSPLLSVQIRCSGTLEHLSFVADQIQDNMVLTFADHKTSNNSTFFNRYGPVWLHLSENSSPGFNPV